MKRIVCELCEGTEFTKENGFFVCQGCGIRYSLAEAKGLLHEVEAPAASVTVPKPSPVPAAAPAPDAAPVPVNVPAPAVEEPPTAESRTPIPEVPDALSAPMAASEPEAEPKPQAAPEQSSDPDPEIEPLPADTGFRVFTPAPAAEASESTPAVVFSPDTAETVPVSSEPDAAIAIPAPGPTPEPAPELKPETIRTETPAASAPSPAPAAQVNINNLLVLASAANESRNYAECENLCNLILAQDTACSKAWFLKARAAGWQSRIGHLRVEETANGFCRSIDCALSEEQDTLRQQAVEELKKLGLALISLRKERFSNQPGTAEVQGFLSDKDAVLKALITVLSHTGTQQLPEAYLRQISILMNQAAVSGFNWARSEWQKYNHPTKDVWDAYLERLSSVEQLLRQAILLSPGDDNSNLTRYQNLVVVIEAPYQAWAWKQQWNPYVGANEWQRFWRLSDEALADRKNTVTYLKARISELQSRIQAQKAEEARLLERKKKDRVKAYWESHSEEAFALREDKRDAILRQNVLREEISQLDKDIEKATPFGLVPTEMALNAENERLKDLMRQRMAVGSNNRKRMQLDEWINASNRKLELLKAQAIAERNERRAKACASIDQLNARKKQLTNLLENAIATVASIDDTLANGPAELSEKNG